MSLEQSLERIAIALEKIANPVTTVNTVTEVRIPEPSTAAVAKPAPTAKPAAKVETLKPISKGPAAKTVTPESLVDDGSIEPPKPAPAKPTHTLADVLDLLKKAAVKHGAPKIKQLMIDHGADKTTPKVETIPATNYPALVSVVKSLDVQTEEKEGIF